MVSLAALPEDRLLAREGRYAVYLVEGNESPLLLDELTRRREEAFRALGEGSGQSRDTDRYDPQYSHLLLDEEGKSIAGSYRARVVRPDDTRRCSKKHLYTASLFLPTSRNFSSSVATRWNWAAPCVPRIPARLHPCFCCGRALASWPCATTCARCLALPALA